MADSDFDNIKYWKGRMLEKVRITSDSLSKEFADILDMANHVNLETKEIENMSTQVHLSFIQLIDFINKSKLKNVKKKEMKGGVKNGKSI